MSTITREIKYTCSNDCKWSGCPSHIATMTMQTTASVFEFKFHKEDEDGIWFDYDSLEAFLKLVEELNISRADMPQIKVLR